MDCKRNRVVLALLGTCLFELGSVQLQGVSRECDVSQPCSCCLNVDACLNYPSNTKNYCYGSCKGCFGPCKDGYWGAKCIKKCPDDCVSCNQSYGQTNECFECVPGKYGINCSKTCPENCETCVKESGNCLICKDGYHGENCAKVCPPNCLMSCNMSSGNCLGCKDNYYGADCAMDCPLNCVTKFCVQNTGACVHGCKGNFLGELCDKCKSGKYGDDCSWNCSAGCKNKMCDKEQGNCILGCKDGFSDSQFCCTNNTYCVLCGTLTACQKCANGTYGIKCDWQCPENCNGACDIFTGKCHDCLPGYYGYDCSNLCSEFCRHKVCDIVSGQCTFGCINNSTAKDCIEECSNTVTRTGSQVITAAAVVGWILVLLPLTIIACLFIRHRYRQSRAPGLHQFRHVIHSALVWVTEYNKMWRRLELKLITVTNAKHL